MRTVRGPRPACARSGNRVEWGMDERTREKIGKRAFWALSLLWLPAGILWVEALRTGSVERLVTALPVVELLPAAPCGLPLALACRRLARLRFPVTACMAWLVLGACASAGLLGPLPVAFQALAACIPVQAMVWRLEYRPRRSPYDPWRLGPERKRSRGLLRAGR